MHTKIDDENGCSVHVAHCCILHGCKYGDDDCPVALGKMKQEFPCESCREIGIHSVEDIEKYKSGKTKSCPHCGHVITEQQDRPIQAVKPPHKENYTTQ